MRNSLRAIALLLCLILLATCVFAADPTSFAAVTEPAVETMEPAAETAEPAAEGWETEPGADPIAATGEPVAPLTEPVTEPATEPAEPVTEPTEPVTEPTEPVTEPTEPVTEPTEPVTEPTEPPEPPEPPVSEMTDEQIINKFSIPDDWARKALVFAVRYGVLAGKGDNNLAPKDNTTHAELATMLISILNTKKEASLSSFTDVSSTSWYYVPMARAVSLGIFPIADPNATKLTPNVPITREEAFVALARMFGVHGDSKQAIYSFSDWKDVSSWAVTDLAAMIETCHIAGSDGKLNPKRQISRREFAQVLYRLIDWIGTELPSANCTGSLALGSSTVPKGTTINGDLLLSTDDTNIRLENLTVTGKLILQGNGSVTIRLKNSNVHEIVACRPTTIQGSDSTIHTVVVHSQTKLYANCTVAKVFCRSLIITGGFTAGTVNLMNHAGMSLAEGAKVTKANVLGDNVYINGNGQIVTLEQRGDNLTNHCNTGTTIQNPYNDASTVEGIRQDSTAATESAPTVKMQLKLKNMPEGWSECDLVWFVNGNEVSRTYRNLLKEGSLISQSYNFSNFMDGLHDSVVFTVYITIDDEQYLIYRGYVNIKESVQRIAATIRTQNVQGKLRANGKLYTSSSLSTEKRSIPAGTQVTILQSTECTATKVRLQDGTEGWTNYYNVAIVSGTYYITTDYSQAVKEYYVNQVRNWGSNTKYMIWVSLYTQRVNIFYGSKGNWRLVRTGPIASGRNDCPTPVEDSTVWGKTERWNYPAPGHDPPFYCHSVSYIDSARGFHSRPTKWGEPYGSILYTAIGYPASAGCVRLMDSECIFIYQTVPLGTAIHIY
ncbi:MAG: S-layer homology domain-containing protein [Oscillospiraceae bacterium]|nr:S-layer homology domain-containing protein [Oscillospiraceae bacterium]